MGQPLVHRMACLNAGLTLSVDAIDACGIITERAVAVIAASRTTTEVTEAAAIAESIMTTVVAEAAAWIAELHQAWVYIVQKFDRL